MTESTEELNEAVEAAETAVDESGQPEVPETPEEAQTAAQDDDADKLTAATERGDALAELLLTRSIEAATAGVLQDPTDLPRSGDLWDDDGVPDLDKIRAAADALVQAKPHLGHVGGDVGQGLRGQPIEPDFSAILREALG